MRALLGSQTALITGGTINGTTIGATTPAAGTFTTLGGTVIAASDSVHAPFVIADSGAALVLSGGANQGGTLNSNTVAQVQFGWRHVANAVNYAEAAGGIANGSAVLGSAGSDSNPSIRLDPKGTGFVMAAGPLGQPQGAPTAKTTDATLTAAELLTGIITANQGAAGAATYTLPTGSDMQTGLPADFATGDSFDFSLVNISTVAAETAALAANTNFTIVGGATVLANSAAGVASSVTFRVRKTASNTFVAYRIG